MTSEAASGTAGDGRGCAQRSFRMVGVDDHAGSRPRAEGGSVTVRGRAPPRARLLCVEVCDRGACVPAHGLLIVSFAPPLLVAEWPWATARGATARFCRSFSQGLVAPVGRCPLLFTARPCSSARISRRYRRRRCGWGTVPNALRHQAPHQTHCTSSTLPARAHHLHHLRPAPCVCAGTLFLAKSWRAVNCRAC